MKILFLALYLTFALAQTPPIWPPHFSIGFFETFVSTMSKDYGGIWYDA